MLEDACLIRIYSFHKFAVCVFCFLVALPGNLFSYFNYTGHHNVKVVSCVVDLTYISLDISLVDKSHGIIAVGGFRSGAARAKEKRSFASKTKL